MARRKRCQVPVPKLRGKKWRITYRRDVAQPDGSIEYRQTSVTLGTYPEMSKAEAQRKALEIVQPINEVQPWVENAGRTMNDLAALWYELESPNVKPSTVASYKWAFKRILPAFGDWPVSEIEFADLQRFMMDCCKQLRGHSPKDLLNRLSGLFSLACDHEWIAKNPIAGRRRRARLIPKLVPVRKVVEITPYDFQRLVAALTMPYDVIVLVAALCGLRRGEIEGLKWRSIGSDSILVQESMYLRQLSSAKSRKSASPVPISRQVREALERWRQSARFTADDDFVFATRKGTPADLHNVGARHLKPACERLGIPKVSWHDLRKATATWARQAGLSVEAVRDMLRHESAALTLDTYSQLAATTETAQRLADFAFSSPLSVASEVWPTAVM